MSLRRGQSPCDGEQQRRGALCAAPGCAPSRSHEDAVFVSQLAESLRGRGYQLQLIGELCRHTTIKTLDAIVTLDVDREAFRQIGFNCFYPLICVDGLVDDPFLFYQVNNNFGRAAEFAGRHGSRAAWFSSPMPSRG